MSEYKLQLDWPEDKTCIVTTVNPDGGITRSATAYSYDDATEKLACNLVQELEHTESKLAGAELQKNIAYSERNQLAAAMAKMAYNLGYAVSLGKHIDQLGKPLWDPEWYNVVYVQMPGGQVSWHIHDSELCMFDWLQRRQVVYDGHTTNEKYERLRAYTITPRSGQNTNLEFFEG